MDKLTRQLKEAFERMEEADGSESILQELASHIEAAGALIAQLDEYGKFGDQIDISEMFHKMEDSIRDPHANKLWRSIASDYDTRANRGY